MPEKRSRQESLAALGTAHDIQEGIYCTASQGGIFNLLELGRSPICCAVPPGHRLSGKRLLTLADLKGESLVLPIEGASYEMDAFRAEVKARLPHIRIVDSSYYGADTFTLCEVNSYVLITQPVYDDIHSNLVTIPLQTDYTMPYGFMYAANPTPATRKFIAAAERLLALYKPVLHGLK